MLSNLGGHAAAFVSLQKGLGLMSSVYRIPIGYFRGRGAVTNTVSTTSYRSAGRPQAIFVIERLTIWRRTNWGSTRSPCGAGT